MPRILKLRASAGTAMIAPRLMNAQISIAKQLQTPYTALYHKYRA